MSMPAEHHQNVSIAARVFAALFITAVITLFAIIIGALILFRINAQARDNAATLRVVLAVTGCTADDTPAECRSKIIAQSTAANNRRAAETDCLIRRAVAQLPVLPEGETCTH